MDPSRLAVTIVDLLIWHAADITTQLVCIGVTVCRPLYKDWLNRIADHIESISSSLPGSKQDTSHGARDAPSLIALQTIGGSAMPRSGGVTPHSGSLGSRAKGRAMRSDATSEEYILHRAATVESDESIAVGQH